MKATTDKASDWSSVYARLDATPMSEHERWEAKESVRKAEIFTELVLSAAAVLGALVHGVEHAALGVASGIRTLFSKPVKH